MIIYATFSNQGGMKRVAESLVRQQIKSDVYHVIFSENKPDPLPENHFWFRWKNVSKNFTMEAVQDFSQQIKAAIPNVTQVKYVIGDCFTLPYFSLFNVQYVYDIHSLSLPLHEQMENDPGYLTMDKLTKFPTSNVVRLSQINFSRAEYQWLKKSIAYVSNSLNTTEYLKRCYPDAIASKPIFQVPVVSQLSSSITSSGSKYPFFTFSRWHPQKGYHLLLDKQWGETPLYVRGIPESEFLPEGLDYLKERSIQLLAWSDNSSELASELFNTEVVLFPAIYEPYGLALREALSLGCLCVAHRNLSGHEEQIEDGVNGFLLDFRSMSLIQDLMKIYQLSESEKSKIRTNAKKSACPTLQEREEAMAKVFEWLRKR